MIALIHEFEHNGETLQVRDYLVFDGGPFTSARIDQIRIALGELLLPGEEVEVLPGDFLGKSGRAHLVIEEFNGKKSNKVGSYLEPEDELPGLPHVAPKAKTPKNDPF